MNSDYLASTAVEWFERLLPVPGSAVLWTCVCSKAGELYATVWVILCNAVEHIAIVWSRATVVALVIISFPE